MGVAGGGQASRPRYGHLLLSCSRADVYLQRMARQRPLSALDRLGQPGSYCAMSMMLRGGGGGGGGGGLQDIAS